jgi:hypothetical protein
MVNDAATKEEHTMSHPSDTGPEQTAEVEAAENENAASAGTEASSYDDLDDLEFLLEEIENRIAPLA